MLALWPLSAALARQGMNAEREFAKALRTVTVDGAIRPPASDKMIAQIEARSGVRLPNDMAWFYRAMNGMNWPTRADRGWILIRDLESWQLIRDEPALNDEPVYPDLRDAVLFCGSL